MTYLLTIIDDSDEAKLLVVKDHEAAQRIHTSLVSNGMMVKKEIVE